MSDLHNFGGLLSLGAALQSYGYSYDMFYKPKYKKPLKKCLRKSCNNMTNHNGGYCSPECCKMDKLEVKR